MHFGSRNKRLQLNFCKKPGYFRFRQANKMDRISILKLLCSIILFLPGSLTKQSRFLFLNAWGALSFATLVLVTYHTSVEISFVLSYTSNPKFRKGPAPEAVPEPDGDNAPVETVTHFSHVFPHMLSGLLNLCFRISAWILFPALVKCYNTLVNMKLAPYTYHRSNWNELIFLLLCIVSVFLRVWQLCIRRPLSLKIEDVIGICGIIGGESFLLQITGVVLVCFTNLVSRNLDHIANVLKPMHFPIAWTIETSSFETKARNYLGNKVLPKAVVDYNSKRLPSLTRILEVRRSYFEWLDLWKDAAGITGTLTFLLFLEMTISISFQSFLAVVSFLEADGENPEKKSSSVEFLLTVQAVLSAICSIGITICLGNAGYWLQNSGENLHLKLLQLIWEFQKTPFQLRHEDLLREKYISLFLESVAHDKVKLTAFSFFTVSRSTLTSIAGVIVTYLVVLIQFRTSSSSDSC